MRFAETRIYADPEIAARKLVELANTIEPMQDGRNPHREERSSAAGS